MNRDPLHLSRWPVWAQVIVVALTLGVIGILTVGMAICWVIGLGWQMITTKDSRIQNPTMSV